VGASELPGQQQTWVSTLKLAVLLSSAMTGPWSGQAKSRGLMRSKMVHMCHPVNASWHTRQVTDSSVACYIAAVLYSVICE
jgi:hypothetical protein